MKPSMRRKARNLALQAVYQWQLSHASLNELSAQFLENCNPKKVDIKYFLSLLKGVLENCGTLDTSMKPFLDRPIAEINPIELAILRIAVYELVYQPETPYKVVINEALELTKKFGAEEGFKYINGVLDKVAKNLPSFARR